ncbi:MAG: hypothetical protein H9535_00980 [Ignavibacteria bacterium]|nr:hypothetical protein [Ignavibacteria bacterium]MBL7990771.1 hypothetical protein [Candidatus Kapabacteria bacterium]
MHYEFSTEHNTLFTNLASKLRTVGITFIVLGVLQSFLALINAGTFGIITGVAGGVLFAVIGVLMVNAASSFKLIVDTEGQDIDNLMQALRSLLSMYTVQFWALVTSVLLVLLVVIQAIIALSAISSRH